MNYYPFIMIYNIYCDESCHLENDHQRAMILGAIWCPKDKSKDIIKRLREIKSKHSLSPRFEIKWTKVSSAKKQFYLDVLDYFFDDDDLHFRALIIPDKDLLDHERFHQTHDEWYYKMYFDLLKVIIYPNCSYNIYLDIKDTRSAEKVLRLKEVLQNARYDFSREIIHRIQHIRSHETELLQLTDLLIGAVSYINRGLSTSSSKLAMIERMMERSGYKLTQTTLLKEEKVNIFRWSPS